MLHDPGSYSIPKIYEHIELTQHEVDVLKQLGETLHTISSLSINQEHARLWTTLNDLKPERPMVWINEIPWHEMNVNDELTLRTTHPWARDLETNLRRTIYQWNHMRCDMVVPPYIECPKVIHSTDFGIHEEVDVVKTDEENEIVSRHFHIQISDMEDVKKISMPTVTHYEKATEASYETMLLLFKDIMPVKLVGQTHIWFTPWDYLIRWTGVQEAMIALYDNPDVIHAAVDALVDAWMIELDQFVEQNLLSLDNNNTRIGSGGYGYSSALPGDDYDEHWVKPHNMWGCSNAQIFSDVSADMHWEFAMEHDLRWLKRWGLTYYGCCEPLQHKIHLLKRIPNLRKVSVSPWNDYATILPKLGSDYVASIKPNPAIFVGSELDEREAKSVFIKAKEASEGITPMEFIMKDISTVNYTPQRLWKWAQLAMESVYSF